MFYKSVRSYMIKANIAQLDEEHFEELLSEAQFQPCHKTQAVSYGFVPPIPDDEEQSMIYTNENCIVFAIKVENKVMPPAAINEALQKKVAEIEDKEGRKVTRKEKTQIKEELVITHLPTALTTSKKIYAYLDKESNMLIADVGTDKDGNMVCDLIRKAIGSFPVVPLNARKVFSSITETWIHDEFQSVEKLAFGGDLELVNLSDKGNKVKFAHHDDLDQAINLLGQGFTTSSIALNYDNTLSFKLNDTLLLKSINFYGLDESYIDECEDQLARFGADFILQVKLFRALFKTIIDTFKLEFEDSGNEEQLEMTGL